MKSVDVASLCADLVKIRSENPPGDTTEVIEYIRRYLEEIGLKSRVLSARKGKDNLLCEPQGRRAGSAGSRARHGSGLLFCGHVDTVPAIPDNWTHPPFAGTVDGGYVHGRGSTDMKGGCASILSAARDLIESGEDLPATLLFVCDEEASGTDGIRYILAKELVSPCDCLIAEPTPLANPNIGQKGLCRVNCHFRGEPGHGSLYPLYGRSAIMEACRVLDHLMSIHGRNFPAPPGMAGILDESGRVLGEILGIREAGSVLTRVMFNPGKIHGGEKSNVVAEQCTLELDMRLPFGCSPEELISEIRALSQYIDVEPISLAQPTITDPSCRLVTQTLEEITRVTGTPASPIFQWAASDARFLREAGFNVIEYGPGDMKKLHAVDERVPIDHLGSATEVYRGLMQRYWKIAAGK